MVHNGRHAFPLDAPHNSKATHSAEEVAEGLISAIRTVGAEKVCAIVTDHASNMRKAWRIVKAEFPHIATIGCYAHGLQLFIGDVCNKVTEDPVDVSASASAGPENVLPDLTADTTEDQDNEATAPLLSAEEFGATDESRDDGADGGDAEDDAVQLHLPSGTERMHASSSRQSTSAYSPSGIIASANCIARFFKSSPKALAKLHTAQLRLYNQKIAICLPGATRWGSQIRCLQEVVKSKAAIQEVLEDEELKRDLKKDKARAAKMATVRKAVADTWFWECVHDFIYAIEPLVRILYVLEADSVSVTVAFDKLAEYATFLPKSNFAKRFPKVIELFQQRMHFLQNTTVGLAYVLDPRFRGRYLTIAQTAAVEDAVRQQHCNDLELRCAFAEYIGNEGPLSSTSIWETASTLAPVAWWQSMSRFCAKSGETRYNTFCNLAISLMCIPASSASSEHSRSTFGFIHSDRRNRLDSDRLKKLVRVHSFIRYERANKQGEDLRFSKFATTPLEDLLKTHVYGGTDIRAVLEELRLALLADVGQMAEA
jgi:hypothetical protein